MSEIQANVSILLLAEKLDSHQSVSTFKNCLLVILFFYKVLADLLLYLSAFYIIAGIFIGWGYCKYTWIYENLVSKKICNVSTSLCFSLFAELLAYVGVFFVVFFFVFVVGDLCRSGYRQNFANFFPHSLSFRS